jgi:methyl-accepting chemotaxis protein
MTPEERLSQTEKLLETAGRYINRHSQTIEQNARDISQLRRTMDETLQLFSELAAYQRQSADEMRQLKTTMSELATYQSQTQQEIQRIWEYLFNQSGNGHSGS